MRRFIFILIVLLLPLRGWMGEAMATEMAAMNLVATQAKDTSAIFDLPSKTNMSNCDMNKTKTAESKTTKPLCTHCQACHATGLTGMVQITSFNKVHYAHPLAIEIQFASASLAHSQKPPIL